MLHVIHALKDFVYVFPENKDPKAKTNIKHFITAIKHVNKQIKCIIDFYYNHFQKVCDIMYEYDTFNFKIGWVKQTQPS